MQLLQGALSKFLTFGKPFIDFFFVEAHPLPCDRLIDLLVYSVQASHFTVSIIVCPRVCGLAAMLQV